jgi:RHS repeat-associated protein
MSLKDAWGNQLSGGTSSERFGFAQREHDTESGLVHMRARMYEPRTGRFTQIEPLILDRASEHYIYTKNRPSALVDPGGQQSREQMEEIARQLGVANPDEYKNEQTKLVKEVQKRLGIAEDGLWGTQTYDAYMKWATDKGKTPVLLAKPAGINEVTEALKKAIGKYGVEGQTPSLGEMVAIAYYEGRDTRGRGGLGVDAEFNSVAGPFARMPARPTAVGIMQINEPTAKDLAQRAPKEMMELLEVTDRSALEPAVLKARTDPEKSAAMALILVRMDVREGLTVQQSMSRRWQTYKEGQEKIRGMGRALENAGLGQPGQNAPLTGILRKGKME